MECVRASVETKARRTGLESRRDSKGVPGNLFPDWINVRIFHVAVARNGYWFALNGKVKLYDNIRSYRMDVNQLCWTDLMKVSQSLRLFSHLMDYTLMNSLLKF